MHRNGCSPTHIGYARLVARCYLRRLESVMPGESPLVRQWILLRTLCARHYGATVAEMIEESRTPCLYAGDDWFGTDYTGLP